VRHPQPAQALARDRGHDQLTGTNHQAPPPPPAHQRTEHPHRRHGRLSGHPRGDLQHHCATGCKQSIHRRTLVEPSPAPSAARTARQRSGLAAQPLPLRPRRGRTRLCLGRAAGLDRCGRDPAGHDPAIPSQGLHSPRVEHAGPQPRGRPPARHRDRPPAPRPVGHSGLDPVFAALNRGELPVRARSGGGSWSSGAPRRGLRDPRR
jgi:hypothetical protein